MKKSFLVIVATMLAVMPAVAQFPTDYNNPIITGQPSLSITPDARGAAMGDAGVATNPDMNSQYWNPAKYAFMDMRGGINATYTPWLRKLGVSDIDLAYLSGFYKWDDVQAVAMSFTYFSMGAVSMTDQEARLLGEAHPHEFSIDASYSRKLHEYVSMAVALRFIYSDLTNGMKASTDNNAEIYHPAVTAAADISVYYRQPISLPMGESFISAGLNLQNLGGKLSYNDRTRNFIPATLRLGAAYEIPFDDYNRLQMTVEARKLMVASKKSKFAKDDGGNLTFDPNDPYNSTTNQYTTQAYSDLNSMAGLFQSFADAPGGAAEEFKEVGWGIGAEYSYNRQFFARVGYSHEDFIKGNRRLVQLGAGFHLSIFMLDFAYTIATAPTNPLDQTMRFTLGFDLAGIKDLVNNKK
ncbi:MAG: type IX secretion system outer membrane channel protein PorV [Paludibacteraceae bacterium]|nr:type IX secretion system outer membrane channel protein PorV [Paludibacteraceae bacterium]